MSLCLCPAGVKLARFKWEFFNVRPARPAREGRRVRLAYSRPERNCWRGGWGTSIPGWHQASGVRSALLFRLLFAASIVIDGFRDLAGAILPAFFEGFDGVAIVAFETAFVAADQRQSLAFLGERFEGERLARPFIGHPVSPGKLLVLLVHFPVPEGSLNGPRPAKTPFGRGDLFDEPLLERVYGLEFFDAGIEHVCHASGFSF